MIKEILFMPHRLKTDTNRPSIYALLKETGYFDLYKAVNEGGILKVVNEYPNCINDWLIYSESKRVDKGWYIEQGTDGSYMVAYFPYHIKSERLTFADPAAAATAFIYREIESIRSNHS